VERKGHKARRKPAGQRSSSANPAAPADEGTQYFTPQARTGNG
jgi:hypothetical protein